MKNTNFKAKNRLPKQIKKEMRYTTAMSVTINLKSQQEFGKRLREIRENKKLFQEDVAKSVGISVTYYAGIERGEENPTFAVIEHICKVLNIRSSEILPF